MRVGSFQALIAGVAALAGAAPAQNIINVTADITVSTTWTSNNVYNLVNQIYVMPGATLTIQAGTVVASTPTTNGAGSLAVTKGAQIFVQGTQQSPVIMTSANDRATWTGGNPKTGTWRAAASEWGNLTILGAGFISASQQAGNTPSFNANNRFPMEGLTAGFPGDTRLLYGGGNDDDDSGTITYLSLRYGGRVIGAANELNGMSLGGLGRGTDMHHIEIMNNVDDGIEIWGGTLNLKHVSIYNVGDDSFDLDQGWRGKAQFGLIVQGYSTDAVQGSGLSDRAFEMDGAETNTAQPATTACLYNFTVIGNLGDTGNGAHFVDNARVQFRNCIFMGFRHPLVSAGAYPAAPDTFPAMWTTPYTQRPALNLPANPDQYYRAQTSGMLCEISDCVFFDNGAFPGANYSQSALVGYGANNNVVSGSSPIQSITYGAPVSLQSGALTVTPVIRIDPRPANAALTSAAIAPNDGFFSPAKYRGAFSPGNNWLTGWTAADAFGFNQGDRWSDTGRECALGANSVSVCSGTGTLTAGAPTTVSLSQAVPNTITLCLAGPSELNIPLGNCTLVPNFVTGGGFIDVTVTSPSGTATLFGGAFPWPAGIDPGTRFWFQWATFDLTFPNLPLSTSNAIFLTTP
jgi:hypothetical protein